MLKKVCILSFSAIARDSRVLREIDMAKEHFKVDVIGYGDWQPPGNVNFLQLLPNKRNFSFKLKYFALLFFGKIVPYLYNLAFWLKPEYTKALEIITSGRYELLHANDWDALPVASNASRRGSCHVIYDAHEYSPGQGAKNTVSRFFMMPFKTYLLKKYHSEKMTMIDASTEFSKLYQSNFGWNSTTIINAPFYREFKFKEVDPSKTKLVHHGVAVPGRKLEEFIDAAALTEDRFHLILMLAPGNQPQYLDFLKEYAQDKAPRRVTFIQAVKPDEVVDAISKYDIGLPFLGGKEMNQYYSQPNKFFDYIMGGLAVVTAPQKGMASIIEENAIGKISPDKSPLTLARELNLLTPDLINKYKLNSLKLAKIYNAETEMVKLLRIYQTALKMDDIDAAGTAGKQSRL